MKKIKITNKFIAEKARVSTATVSYVLNNIPNSGIPERTKKTILQIAEKYNYFPNMLARSLVMKKTFNIGFINTLPLVYFLQDSFQRSIFAGIESEIERQGYSMVFSLLKNQDNINIAVKKILLGNIVDGILIYGKVKKNLIDLIRENNINYMLVDYYINDIKEKAVLPDNFQGAYEATQYLIKKKLKKIYFLNGNINHPSYRERPAGYEKAMLDADLSPKVIKTDTSSRAAYEFMLDFIDKNDLPEAFFTAGDTIAVGIMHALKDKKIKIPQQVKVMGFDDTVSFETEKLKLSTVHVPKMQMGIDAVKLLIKQINGESDIRILRLPTHLVIRASA